MDWTHDVCGAGAEPEVVAGREREVRCNSAGGEAGTSSLVATDGTIRLEEVAIEGDSMATSGPPVFVAQVHYDLEGAREPTPDTVAVQQNSVGRTRPGL